MKKNKIIAVDFDGTLCESKYPEIGEPRTDVIERLIKEQREGARVILWTCRNGEDLMAAIYWALDKGITFDAVNANLKSTVEHFGSNSRKIYADEYWDDKAVELFEREEKTPTEREKALASDILKAIRARSIENYKSAAKCFRPHDIDACLLNTREQEDLALYSIVAAIVIKHGLDASECDKK